MTTETNADGSIPGTPEGVRVYPVDGEFVVADDSGWVPGVYETADAAVGAASEPDFEETAPTTIGDIVRSAVLQALEEEFGGTYDGTGIADRVIGLLGI